MFLCKYTEPLHRPLNGHNSHEGSPDPQGDDAFDSASDEEDKADNPEDPRATKVAKVKPVTTATGCWLREYFIEK